MGQTAQIETAKTAMITSALNGAFKFFQFIGAGGA
jgi:hypothetical protein